MIKQQRCLHRNHNRKHCVLTVLHLFVGHPGSTEVCRRLMWGAKMVRSLVSSLSSGVLLPAGDFERIICCNKQRLRWLPGMRLTLVGLRGIGPLCNH